MAGATTVGAGGGGVATSDVGSISFTTGGIGVDGRLKNFVFELGISVVATEGDVVGDFFSAGDDGDGHTLEDKNLNGRVTCLYKILTKPKNLCTIIFVQRLIVSTMLGCCKLLYDEDVAKCAVEDDPAAAVATR